MVQSKKQDKYMVICMCGSRNFHQVGGGGGGGVEDPGPPDSKKLGQRCFVIFATYNLLNSFTEGTDPGGPIPGSNGLFFGKQ